MTKKDFKNANGGTTLSHEAEEAMKLVNHYVVRTFQDKILGAMDRGDLDFDLLRANGGFGDKVYEAAVNRGIISGTEHIALKASFRAQRELDVLLMRREQDRLDSGASADRSDELGKDIPRAEGTTIGIVKAPKPGGPS
jgi:hypothetical protein